MQSGLLQPLVSCVMPTANRRCYVAHSIRYFQSQDYGNKELVILDDGDDSIVDLVPPDPQIRYVRLTGHRTLGDKRNECVMASRGDLIMHWDDDDWMAPHRISYQVNALLEQRAEICGLQRMLFYDQASGNTWLYVYPEAWRPWLAGGSLLYTREFWQRSPFVGMQVASDTQFVWGQGLDNRAVLQDYGFYVAMIHSGNTSAKDCREPCWTRWNGDIAALLGDDLEFYKPVTHLAGSRREPRQLVVEQPARPAVESPELALTSAVAPEPEPRRSHDAPAKTPLVSCILATGNRPAFARQAIRCFLRQTYDNSELIVVDDGAESVADLCAGLYRVRHIRVEQPIALGTKLNIGIKHSAGEVIQKLDDDDYYHERFLERAVAVLPKSDRKHALVTWDCFMILMAGEQYARYSGHGWTVGATLCFHRSLWEKGPFQDAPRHVDTLLIEDHRPNIIKVCEPELYMLVRHGHNTWTALSGGASVDGYFQRLPVYHKPLRDLVEPLDLMFYSSLTKDPPR